MLLSRGQPMSWTVVMAAALFLCTSLAAAQLIPVDFCSDFNTASMAANYSDFQSQGLCFGFCKDRKFGLAIVKRNDCWCSNSLPSDDIQVSKSKCRNPCPGFPADLCGGDSTFGYMRINSNPIQATTNGGSRDDPATGRRPPETPAPSRVTVTVSPSISSTSDVTASSRGGSRRTTQSVETVTVDGIVRTVTAPPNSDSTDSSESNSSRGGNGGGLGGGAIAGIVVGILAIFAIGGIIGFLVMRRKKAKEEAYESAGSQGGSGAAMAHVPRSPDDSNGFGGRVGGRRPTNGTYGSDHSSGRRSSMLMPGDPRMNPSTGIYSRADLNKSHDSFLSIQDNRDYSRPVHEPPKVLKVTNASPDDID